MNKKLVIIALLLSLILVTGCSNEKCVKSHTEKTICIMYQHFPNSNGGVRMVPFFYPCEKEVCDLYESEVTNAKD